jgi:hypothetical protein
MEILLPPFDLLFLRPSRGPSAAYTDPILTDMTTSTSKFFLLVSAAAAIFSATPSANAALAYTGGDLLLGFRRDGATFDYVIDLGAASSFRDASSPFTLSLAGLNTDLTSAFGSNWKTLGDVLWGIVGTPGPSSINGDAANLVYISEPVGTNPLSSSAQSTVRVNIQALSNLYDPIASQGVARGSLNGNIGNSVSWTTKMAGVFGASGNLSPIEAPLQSSLDLYRLPNSSDQALITNEGRFSFNFTDATITFTPTPEPTGAALLCLSVGSLAGVRRFRRKA